MSALEATAAALAVVSSTMRAPSHVVTGRLHTGIPAEIESNVSIDEAMKLLPINYSFEVKKTIWKIKQSGASRVALQFPEGLLLYSCLLADILGRFTGAEMVVMGDVTYGACCVDDFSASALGCDFLVHYGHSCLVPIDVTASAGLRVMYVFVEISFDTRHLAATIAGHWHGPVRVALMGTVQFVGMLHTVRDSLGVSHPHVALTVPQAKPLSPGETLGCTAARLGAAPDGLPYDALVFVADGRFHLEAALIANPGLPAFRYDPYAKRMSSEGYDHGAMTGDRQAAVRAGAVAGTWGLILGTLGRQGSPAVLARLEEAAAHAGKRTFTLAASEIKPAVLARFGPEVVQAWVQVACPRLSIDWGAGFGRVPLLNPYEAHVALGLARPWWGGEALNPQAHAQVETGTVPAPPYPYPMDYYARDAGPWGNYWKEDKGGPAKGKAHEMLKASL